jgi:hypothetical protein
MAIKLALFTYLLIFSHYFGKAARKLVMFLLSVVTCQIYQLTYWFSFNNNSAILNS